MKHKFSPGPIPFFILFFLFTCIPSIFFAQQDIHFKILKNSRISLEGKSNLNSFSCDYKEDFPPLKMLLNSTPTPNVIYFLETRVEFTTEKLDCGNKGISRDLSKTLKADQYPKIYFELHSISFQAAAHYDEWQKLVARADISIAGKTRRLNMDIKSKQIGEGQILIQGAKTLNMSDFDIEPPTALMGLIKVKDEIRLHFDLSIAFTNLKLPQQPVSVK